MTQRKLLTHLALLLVTCLVTAGLIYWQTSEPPYVEALLKINRDAWPRDAQPSDEAFNSYVKTQGLLLKSNFVATVALRDNDINQLPVIHSLGKHPVDRLANSIETTHASGELIGVRVPLKRWVSQGEAKDWERILDGVVDAYIREIVNKERIDEVDELSKLRRRYQTTYQLLTKKADEVLKLEETLGLQDTQGWRNDYQLRRIDRLESKILELQLRQQALTIESKTEDLELKIVQTQISTLTKQRDVELEKLPQGDAAGDGSLVARKQDYLALQNDMIALRQEMSQLENQIDGPRRVSVVSAAVISYEKDNPFSLAAFGD